MGNCRSKKGEENVISSNSEQLKQQLSTEMPYGHTSQIEAHVSGRSTNLLGSLPYSRESSRPCSSSNNDVIDSAKAEVSGLLEEIDAFQGTTETDKNYRYLDEMLTRCMLKLDRIECNNPMDRNSRKEAIRGVTKAISILERKLEINSDIKELESNLSET